MSSIKVRPSNSTFHFHRRRRQANPLQTILIPALLALALYLLTTYLLLPLWRAHRQRYAQYLPVPAASHLSATTASLRHRVSDALASFLVPESLRARFARSRGVVDGSRGAEHDDGFDDDDDAEGLVDLAVVEAARREALEERRRTLERRRRVDGDAYASDRRLSRDLEEGFMDESDEEDAGEVEGRGDTAGRERWRG